MFQLFDFNSCNACESRENYERNFLSQNIDKHVNQPKNHICSKDCEWDLAWRGRNLFFLFSDITWIKIRSRYQLKGRYDTKVTQ